MDAQYSYRFPSRIPACSLRIGTLNVNGALFSSEQLTIDTISHLMEAADISVFGLTDARISHTHVDSTTSLFRGALP